MKIVVSLLFAAAGAVVLPVALAVVVLLGFAGVPFDQVPDFFRLVFDHFTQ